MARAGIYKSEVVRARDKLLALGTYPSIDAVRAELGNTGSKSTIHRYLKEIEEEEGVPTGSKVAVSDAIQDLIGRLAGRLHEEADARVAEAAAQFKAKSEQQASATAALKQEAEAFRVQLERTQQALVEEQALHEHTAANLRNESLELAKLKQQVLDLQERLVAEEQHRQSLEARHVHAREALDHFRLSAKEQREQDQRQHEQQVQYLQGEVRTLNQALAAKQHEAVQSGQEKARLATELAHATTALHQTQMELQGLQRVSDQFIASERRVEALGKRLVEEEAKTKEITSQNSIMEARSSELTERIRALEVDLAAAKAALAAQNGIVDSFRLHLVSLQPGKGEIIPPELPATKPSRHRKKLQEKG